MRALTFSNFQSCCMALCMIIALALLPSSFAFAAPNNLISSSDMPTKINADTMNYNAEKNVVEFSGDVYVEREDFSLWSELLFVHLKKTNENDTNPDPMASMKSGDISTIVAEKNVRMKYGTNLGKARKVTFKADEEIIIMQGNPLLKDGDNSITGEEIRYYMKENRSEVIGGKKRVEAFFSSGDKN